jgi:hypothetical protein
MQARWYLSFGRFYLNGLDGRGRNDFGLGVHSGWGTVGPLGVCLLLTSEVSAGEG